MNKFYGAIGCLALTLAASNACLSAVCTGQVAAMATSPTGQPAFDRSALVRALCRKVAYEQRCVLLIDGLPVNLPDPGNDYETRVASQKGDVRAVVSRLADALDCDVSVSGKLFFLTHRYRTGNSLPGITLPECAAFLRDMEGILKQFRAYRSSDTTMAGSGRLYGDAIVQSFSESQWRIMKDEGLPIAKLGPEQERMVSTFGAFFYIDTYLQTVRNLQKRLGEISSPEALFTSQQLGGRRVYGIDFPSGSRRLFLPLTAPGSFLLESQGGLGMASGQLIMDASSDSEGGSKEIGSKIGSPIDDAFPAVSETLADIMQRSNQRLLQPRSPSPIETAVLVMVDDALGEKPLEVFGAEGMSSAALAESISRLYNLRVTRVTAAKYLLTRRARIGVRDISSLAPAVRRATPSPLARYVYGRVLQRTERETQRLKESALGEEPPAFPPGISFDEIGKLPDDLRRSAAEVLFAYAATLDKENSLAAKPVPVPRLSAQARSAIANFVMAEMIGNLPKYLSEPPAYISNLKNGTVRAEIQESEGKKRYTLTVEAPLLGNTATTIRRSVIGVGGAAYPGSPN